MPQGILLIGWTNKEGFFLIHNHPSDTTLSVDDVMEIGSLHRMRNLEPNRISIHHGSLRVASFFTGMFTKRYWLAPNFVISLILNEEDEMDYYLNALPIAAQELLEALRSGADYRFEKRTTRQNEVIAAIGDLPRKILPRIYEKVSSGSIAINEQLLKYIFEPDKVEDTELESAKRKIAELETKISEMDVIIKTYQQMMHDSEKDEMKEGLHNKLETVDVVYLNRVLFITLLVRNFGENDLHNFDWDWHFVPFESIDTLGVIWYPPETLNGTLDVFQSGEKMIIRTQMKGFGIIGMEFSYKSDETTQTYHQSGVCFLLGPIIVVAMTI